MKFKEQIAYQGVYPCSHSDSGVGFLSSMDARILLASFVKDMTFFNFLPLTLIVSTWFTDSSYSEITMDSPDYTVKNKTSQVLGSIKPNNNTSSYILIL